MYSTYQCLQDSINLFRKKKILKEEEQRKNFEGKKIFLADTSQKSK